MLIVQAGELCRLCCSPVFSDHRFVLDGTGSREDYQGENPPSQGKPWGDRSPHPQATATLTDL